MRGPRMMLFNKRQHKRKSQGFSPTDVGPDVITSLTWSICPLDNGMLLHRLTVPPILKHLHLTDSRLLVRLIAVTQSGTAEIYTSFTRATPQRGRSCLRLYSAKACQMLFLVAPLSSTPNLVPNYGRNLPDWQWHCALNKRHRRKARNVCS
jgi:hypothetical protein